jgi:hypothetical protein
LRLLLDWLLLELLFLLAAYGRVIEATPTIIAHTGKRKKSAAVPSAVPRSATTALQTSTVTAGRSNTGGAREA